MSLSKDKMKTFKWFWVTLIFNFCCFTSFSTVSLVLPGIKLVPTIFLGRWETFFIFDPNLWPKITIRWWSHGGTGWIERHERDKNITISATCKKHLQSYFKKMILFLGVLTGSNRIWWLFVGRKLYQCNPSMLQPVGNRKTLICVILTCLVNNNSHIICSMISIYTSVFRSAPHVSSHSIWIKV